MRIAVFAKSTTFHKNYGGLETQNKVLCEGLVQRGHEVTVFSPKKELDVEEAAENGVFYRFIPSVYRTITPFWKYGQNWFKKSARVFAREHKDKPFDIVISQSSAGVGIIKIKEELGVKVIAVSHGSILAEFKTKIVSARGIKEYLYLLKDVAFVLMIYFGRQRHFVLGANKVVAVSGAVKQLLMDETFASDEHIKVIYNGIDPGKFNGYLRKPDSQGKIRLLFIGRVVRSKGVFDLLKVFKELSDEEDKVILNIVGDGEDLEALVSAAKQTGLEDKVNFLGKIPYDEVASKLFASDVFVLPTLRVEGFPMTLPEAMFAELPVVANDLGGVSDAVEDGVTGFFNQTG
jgi:glycosyltransferase involved in cell wall biosynthesis